MSYAIAIDGPAGAGKSTIARLIAKRLGYIYIDTGAMFRGIAVYVLDAGIALEDEAAIAACIDTLEMRIEYINGMQQIICNGVNITSRLRDESTGNAASIISAYGCVRSKLLMLQRKMADIDDVVMDGRDIGTTVLPSAQVKVYLTASVDARAQRRYEELIGKGQKAVLADIKTDITTRDYQDMHRAISPLKKAEDAVLIDSSDMSIEEVADAVIGMIR